MIVSSMDRSEAGVVTYWGENKVVALKSPEIVVHSSTSGMSLNSQNQGNLVAPTSPYLIR